MSAQICSVHSDYVAIGLVRHYGSALVQKKKMHCKTTNFPYNIWGGSHPSHIPLCSTVLPMAKSITQQKRTDIAQELGRDDGQKHSLPKTRTITPSCSPGEYLLFTLPSIQSVAIC